MGGTLAKIKENHNQGSQDCYAKKEDEMDTHRLSLSDVSGIFMMHYVVLVLVLMVSFFHVKYPRHIPSSLHGLAVVRRACVSFEKKASNFFKSDIEEQYQIEEKKNENCQQESYTNNPLQSAASDNASSSAANLTRRDKLIEELSLEVGSLKKSLSRMETSLDMQKLQTKAEEQV